MAKRVVYTDEAFADIDRIIEFNDRRNQSNAYSRKFLKGLRQRLQKQLKQPYSGLRTDKQNVFLLIWDNYYIYYKPEANKIEVVAIYHQKEVAGR